MSPEFHGIPEDLNTGISINCPGILPNFSAGTAALCLGYAVFFANILLLPLWLQTNIGYTATWAGLVAAPSGLVAVVLTPLTARLLSRIDARWVATISFVAFAV